MPSTAAAKTLARAFPDSDALLAATAEQFEALEDFGEITAHSLAHDLARADVSRFAPGDLADARYGELFRQALQDPSGTLSRICDLGNSWGLPVSRDEVKAHLASVDDADTKQWLLKARGGL